MGEYCGWVLDVYADAAGVVVWLLDEAGERRRLRQALAVAFYVAGEFAELRRLWAALRAHPARPQLGRTRRVDLFAGRRDVMEVRAVSPAAQQMVFRQAVSQFPHLDYYDADIPVALRYAAEFEVFPLARCRVAADEAGDIQAITPLDTPWDIHPPAPPLRVLTFAPDTEPAHRRPTRLLVGNGRGEIVLALEPEEELLSSVQSLLRRHDPDLVLTRWGDTWLFPLLLDIQRRTGAQYFNPNRDPECGPLRRGANSYFTYGQVVYRGEQVHLFGRWHIDEANAMMYGEYGLAGVLEQARVTGLPVQEVARKSPGAGITAMQMLTALRREVMVPYQKQQTERFKSALDLIHADRGGLVYQPLIGLHHDVAELDFTSMYPSIMTRFNISPESVGRPVDAATCEPEMGLGDPAGDGLVPATLRPLLGKRLAIKGELSGMNPLDCRYKTLKARAAALKWLLVVCFGYLGYKNARFGRIEGHEAVTAYGREMLLRAKEAAEDLGYTVLHMYVDGLWIVHPEGTAGRLGAVMEEIVRRTGLPIWLEGVYRWIAFLPSRRDARVPVANRYFGVFEDGSFKIRGIEARRHDTPPFVAQTQVAILEMLAAADGPLEERLPAVVGYLRQRLDALREGRVEAGALLVSHRVSRPVEAYKARTAAVRALEERAAVGKRLEPGQRVRFIHTRGEPGVYAWGVPEAFDPAAVDVGRYSELVMRAAGALLQPVIEEGELRRWVEGGWVGLKWPGHSYINHY